MDQRKPLPRKAGFISLFVFAVIWSGMVAFLGHAMLTEVWRQWHAQETYVAVPATVLSSAVEEVDGDEGTSYRPRIAYEFEVSGVRYRGDRTKFGAEPSGRRTVRAIVRDHPPGAAITIYHDPHDPGRAVIFPEVTGADVTRLVFMIPFNIAGLGMLFASINGLRNSRDRPAGNTLIADNGVVARLRLTEAKAIYALLGVPGVVCFLGAVVLAIGWGFKPPIEMPLAILGASAILGAWCAWHTHRALCRGDYELIVDRRFKTLTLPLYIAKQLGRETLPFNEVERVVVVTERRAEDSESPDRHFVKLETKSGIDSPLVTLLQAGNQERAEDLAQWLRTQVGTSVA